MDYEHCQSLRIVTLCCIFKPLLPRVLNAGKSFRLVFQIFLKYHILAASFNQYKNVLTQYIEMIYFGIRWF